MHKAPTTFDDVPFVEAMIDAISLSEYMVDNNRIYVCGYSLGGEFTYELACSLNNRIAAAGAVARTMQGETFNNCAPQHPTGVLTILGTSDAISDYNGITFNGIQYYMSAAETHQYWATANNCAANPTMTTIPNTNTSDGSTVERYTWADASGCAYVEHLKVINGGHDWPGSFGNMDIDASQEIWSFVSRYNLSGLIGCGTNSIEHASDLDIGVQVYPNPVIKDLYFNMSGEFNTQIKVYNQQGALMMQTTTPSNQGSIDVSALCPGIYTFKIGNSYKRFIKQ